MVGLVIRRIIEYKTRFGLHPLIATDAEIERETGVNRAEIARISHEFTKDGRMYYGRTINGKYYGLNTEFNSQDIMKGFQTAIKDHLEKMAAQDEAFAEKYAARCESEDESIKKCCSYIIKEVQKKYKQGNSAVLTDAEVFGIAMHYYDENVAAPKSASSCKVVMSKAELTPEDEEAIRQEARAAAEARIRKRNAEKEAKERKEIAQREEAYGKHIAPYLGLCFVAGDIEIRPLPTVMSVYEEGEAMHHCIYRMKYWQKTDTLLMSARSKEGKRLESIEVNLRDYKVLQSRGLQNQPTEQHDTIVSLIKKNMNQIKRIRKAI